ncbi:MAG: HAD family hydrolase [Hamadaea sp.]|nr:HAD family hydrolase [Hamadaea sp.]
MLPPRALLLDFGGVLAEAIPDVPDPALPDRVHGLIGRAVPVARIAADMRAAEVARAEWRADAERPELTHAQLWGDVVAKDWPEEAREIVVGWSVELARAWAARDFALVDGVSELLDYTLGRGLPVAIVSNTRCGLAYRDFLESQGLTAAFAAQIYSDELGVFKPHPRMIIEATRAIDVPASSCWFVGDSLSRDVECGRRAGVGAAILRPSTYWGGDKWDAEPDAVVADGHELLKLLKRALDA